MNSIDRNILIIGIGNEYRGDDGIGILAARELKSWLLPSVEVVEAVSLQAETIDRWKQYYAVIIIDAVVSGLRPGTIHRVDARAGAIPPIFCHCSSHTLDLAEAIELARIMDWVPAQLVVYGLEAKQFAKGAQASDEVAEALPVLTDRVRAELEQVYIGKNIFPHRRG